MNRKEILLNPNGWSLEQLYEAVNAEVVTYEELLSHGLRFAQRDPLLNMVIEPLWQKCLANNSIEDFEKFRAEYGSSKYANIAEQKIVELKKGLEKEEAFWRNTCAENTIQAYNLYLTKFPNGKYINDAEFKVSILEDAIAQKKKELFDEMRYYPQKFDRTRVQNLFEGQDIRYSEVAITPEELVNEGVITSPALSSILNDYRFELHQKTVDELPPLPNGFSDVYFFGVPASGKSCVLSGLLHAADKLGEIRYIPQEFNGIDPCRDYYDSVTNCIGHCLVPEATGNETCNFMSVRLRHDKDDRDTAYNNLSMVEMGGEFFINATESFTNQYIDVKDHGIIKYLSNDNRKMMFFVIDYSKVLASDYGDLRGSETKQKISLQRALDVFSTDGTGKNRGENCTFSKTDSVVVIITKSDLMGVDSREERLEVAKEYLRNIYEAFMVNLREICQQFNINRTVENRPLVTTFSLGEFMIGNTVNYNDRDSIDILNLLKSNTRSHTSPNTLGTLIKYIFSVS